MVEISIVSRFQKDDTDLRSVLAITNHAWVPEIISRLDYYGQLRYNQIKRSLKGVSSTSLSRSLSYMQRHGLVSRTVYETTPPKVVYTLTKRGGELGRMINDLKTLGTRWNDKDQLELVKKVSGPD